MPRRQGEVAVLVGELQGALDGDDFQLGRAHVDRDDPLLRDPDVLVVGRDALLDPQRRVGGAALPGQQPRLALPSPSGAVHRQPAGGVGPQDLGRAYTRHRRHRAARVRADGRRTHLDRFHRPDQHDVMHAALVGTLVGIEEVVEVLGDVAERDGRGRERDGAGDGAGNGRAGGVALVGDAQRPRAGADREQGRHRLQREHAVVRRELVPRTLERFLWGRVRELVRLVADEVVLGGTEHAQAAIGQHAGRVGRLRAVHEDDGVALRVNRHHHMPGGAGRVVRVARGRFDVQLRPAMDASETDLPALPPGAGRPRFDDALRGLRRPERRDPRPVAGLVAPVVPELQCEAGRGGRDRGAEPGNGDCVLVVGERERGRQRRAALHLRRRAADAAVGHHRA